MREYILNNLFRIFQICPEVIEEYKEAIAYHEMKLDAHSRDASQDH